MSVNQDASGRGLSSHTNRPRTAQIDQPPLAILHADGSGNIYYSVLKLHDTGVFYQNDAIDSWLVKVAANDTIMVVSYTGLNPRAPAPTVFCVATFGEGSLPWPPSPTAIPGSVTCGLQRVAFNIAPAVASDGTIYSDSCALHQPLWLPGRDQPESKTKMGSGIPALAV